MHAFIGPKFNSGDKGYKARNVTIFNFRKGIIYNSRNAVKVYINRRSTEVLY